MTLEDFLQNYDSKAKYRYIKDYEGILLLTQYITRPSRLMHVINPHMAQIVKPKARQDLPMESQNEGVYCNTCHTTLAIRRLRPKLTSSLVLSNQYSSYIPQSIQFCTCRALATKVDDRGRLRVYGDRNTIALVNYLEGFPIHHQLSHQKRAEIDSELLDAPKLKYSWAMNPRYMWSTNFIDLTNLDIIEQELLLPTDPGMPRRLFHQAYAYRFQIAILTEKYLVLPSGIYIDTRDHFLKSLLTERIDPPSYMRDSKNATIGMLLRSAKLNTSINKHASEVIDDLLVQLAEHHNLPYRPARYWPFQGIGYLHVYGLDQWHAEKGYVSSQYHKLMIAMRNASRKYLRSLILGLPYQFKLQTLPAVPPQALLYSHRIPLKQTQILYWSSKRPLP